MTFVPPKKTFIFETSHWRVNHRVDTTLPGYCMVGARAGADWGELSSPALAELGSVLAQSVQAITDSLHPQRVYVSRYGHSPGHSLHFHLIPVYDWLVEAYRQDERYRELELLYAPGSGVDPDGADLTLYVWREYVEARRLPAESSVEEAIRLLKRSVSTR